MSKIELWERPISSWQIKIFPSGFVGCSVYKPAARSIKAKLADRKFSLIVQAAAALTEFEHPPETYQSEVTVVLVVFDSGASRYLLLSDFPPESDAHKILEDILYRVVRATEGMTGLIDIEAPI